MLDLFIHAGTKFALEQWLDARGLGGNVQDTDATSPTFGDYFYTHTDRNSTFIYWRHPSGKLEATAPVIDGNGDVTTPATFFNGFYGILRFKDFDAMNDQIGAWVRNNTAVSVLEGFAGYGGEGITIIAPEDVQAHLDAEGIPGHEFLGGMGWSDPRVWFLGPVMTGDVREFDGTEYTSLIDFNIWTPTQAPETWGVVQAPEPTIEPWVPLGGDDVAGTYRQDYRWSADPNDTQVVEVTHPNAQDSGNVWLFRSKIAANTAEPGTDGSFHRYWEPVERV